MIWLLPVLLLALTVPAVIMLFRARRSRQAPVRGPRGRGGGRWAHMSPMVWWRGTVDQWAGALFPWMLGSGVPMQGVPIGKVTRKGRAGTNNKGATLCCDPYSWYHLAKLISNPSAFVLGLPGLGKSTLVRKWVLGLDYFGVVSLVLGDLKGEYVDLIRQLGGQVIPIGRARGHINVLDMGSTLDACRRLREAGFHQEAEELLAVSRGRRQAAVETLLTLHRSTPLRDKEVLLVAAALRELDSRITDRVPIIEDLWDLVETPTATMHAAAQSYDDLAQYRAVAGDLLSNLQSLANGYGLGEVFSQETTVRFRVDTHAVFDVSALDDTDTRLRAAALMLSWAIGFGEVAVANTLAAVGLAEQRNYHIVVDELWRALRAAEGLPDLADGLTRLNRDKGVVTTFVSHSMDDLAAVQTRADVAKARGILDRCGMVVAFGLRGSEMPALSEAVHLTQVERETLTRWTAPPTWSPQVGKNAQWPGRGLCLVKVGERPGIPVQIELTELEKPYSDTAKKWLDAQQVAA